MGNRLALWAITADRVRSRGARERSMACGPEKQVYSGLSAALAPQPARFELEEVAELPLISAGKSK